MEQRNQNACPYCQRSKLTVWVAKVGLLGNQSLQKGERLAVVGGGFSGLSLATFAKSRGHEVTIYEAGQRVGGLLGSVDEGFGIVEQAANGIVNCLALEALCDIVEIKTISPLSTAKGRFIFHEGKPRKWPLSLNDSIGFSKRLLTSSKIEGDTLEDFGGATLGEKATQTLLEPAFFGVYAARASELAWRAAFPKVDEADKPKRLIARLLEMQKRTREPGLTIKGTVGFKGGMQELVDGMSHYLGDSIHLNHPIRNADTFQALLKKYDKVALCLPAHQLINLFDPDLARLFQSVRYLPLVTVTVNIKLLEEKSFKGFGTLFPVKEQSVESPFLGVLYNSNIFPNRVKSSDIASLTLIGGGSIRPEMIDWTEEQLLQAAQNQIARLNLPHGETVHFLTTKWEKALPLYSPSHLTSLKQIHSILQAEYKSLSLLSNFTGSLSLRGMVKAADGFST